MKDEELKAGKVYILKGGLILRCFGPYSREGHQDRQETPMSPPTCYSFRSVQDPQDGMAIGYSAWAESVIREITVADISMLKDRREQCLSRKLKHEVEDMDFLLKELFVPTASERFKSAHPGIVLTSNMFHESGDELKDAVEEAVKSNLVEFVYSSGDSDWTTKLTDFIGSHPDLIRVAFRKLPT